MHMEKKWLVNGGINSIYQNMHHFVTPTTIHPDVLHDHWWLGRIGPDNYPINKQINKYGMNWFNQTDLCI